MLRMTLTQKTGRSCAKRWAEWHRYEHVSRPKCPPRAAKRRAVISYSGRNAHAAAWLSAIGGVRSMWRSTEQAHGRRAKVLSMAPNGGWHADRCNFSEDVQVLLTMATVGPVPNPCDAGNALCQNRTPPYSSLPPLRLQNTIERLWPFPVADIPTAFHCEFQAEPIATAAPRGSLLTCVQPSSSAESAVPPPNTKSLSSVYAPPCCPQGFTRDCGVSGGPIRPDA